MSDTEKRLGRGLESLMTETKAEAAAPISQVSPDSIVPNPFQPRERIDPGALEGLMRSIQQNGILQPVAVRKTGTGYQLVAGERRWRAALQLGLPTIPVVVREVPDERMLELALIENIQREDLNPIEKAKAYQQLMKTLNVTQEQAASRLGQDRATVANFIRLLDLPEEIQEIVSRGTISMGHARAILALSDRKAQWSICQRIVKDDLSVRATEMLVGGPAKKKASKKKAHTKAAHLRDIEQKLGEKFGTKARIEDKGGKGHIVLEYYTPDDFQRIIEIVGIKLES
jgi:ParB family chromosome partitioning protein